MLNFLSPKHVLLSPKQPMIMIASAQVYHDTQWLEQLPNSSSCNCTYKWRQNVLRIPEYAPKSMLLWDSFACHWKNVHWKNDLDLHEAILVVFKSKSLYHDCTATKIGTPC